MFYIAIEIQKTGEIKEVTMEKFRSQAKAEARAREWQDMFGSTGFVTIVDTRTGAAI